jgi:hypothetical protein
MLYLRAPRLYILYAQRKKPRPPRAKSSENCVYTLNKYMRRLQKAADPSPIFLHHTTSLPAALSHSTAFPHFSCAKAPLSLSLSLSLSRERESEAAKKYTTPKKASPRVGDGQLCHNGVCLFYFCVCKSGFCDCLCHLANRDILLHGDLKIFLVHCKYLQCRQMNLHTSWQHTEKCRDAVTPS